VIGNTVFGLIAAMLLARHRFPGRAALNALIDLPLAVSPVVVGLALILVYGRFEPIGRFLDNHGIKVIFSLPGMVLATIFVSLPLLARELVPVLEEIGIEQEQAAWTLGASGLQTFRRITLPAIRWALAYGVVLTLARALGEFGAVAVVSGGLVGKTQTLTLYVQQEFQNFDPIGAYAASFVLAVIAIVVLIIINVLRPKEHS
jgi:sulfate transport system permease protein